MTARRPLVNIAGAIQELPSGDTVVGGGGGSGTTYGTAIVDFGAFPGSNEATVSVTGQTGILSTDAPRVWVSGSDEVLGGGDAYYANTPLILNFTGSHGSATFTDQSQTPKTVTAFGNAALTTTGTIGGVSCYESDGTGDYASWPTSSDFDFGSGAFTVEIKYQDLGGNDIGDRLLQFSDGDTFSGFTLSITNTNELSFYYSYDGFNWQSPIVFSTHPTNLQMIEVSRSSVGIITVRLDGVTVGSAYGPGILFYDSGASLVLTGQSTPDRSAHCRIYGLRITKGVQRNAADYTPDSGLFPAFLGGISGHTANDHRYLQSFAQCNFTAGTPTTGVGFPIYATSPNKLQGSYKVRFAYP